MRVMTLDRACRVVVCFLATVLLLSGPRAALASSEYVLDIKGTLELVGERADRAGAGSGRVVQYWVIFQYREPGVEGPSFQDRIVQVEDKKFEVEGLLRDKVYRIFVQRVVVDPSLPGGGSREEIPLFLPDDFWRTIAVSPQAPPPSPAEIDLAVTAPDSTSHPPRSLSFQYNGKEIRLAAYAAAPGVS